MKKYLVHNEIIACMHRHTLSTLSHKVSASQRILKMTYYSFSPTLYLLFALQKRTFTNHHFVNTAANFSGLYLREMSSKDRVLSALNFLTGEGVSYYWDGVESNQVEALISDYFDAPTDDEEDHRSDDESEEECDHRNECNNLITLINEWLNKNTHHTYYYLFFLMQNNSLQTMETVMKVTNAFNNN